MPIQLTTPHTYKGEHGQPDEIYPFVEIVDFRVKPNQRLAIFVLEYGNYDLTDPEKPLWVSGKAEKLRHVVCDKPEERGMGYNAEGEYAEGVLSPAITDFTDMSADLVVVAGHVGMEVYDVLGAGFYQWFIDHGFYEGTVV